MKRGARRQDLTAARRKFGLLTPLRPAPNRNGRTFWLCLCKGCGKEVELETTRLNQGVDRCPTCSLKARTKCDPVEAKRLRGEGLNNAQIGRALGVTRQAVKIALDKLEAAK